MAYYATWETPDGHDCAFDQANQIIREIESVLEQRDARIAEMETRVADLEAEPKRGKLAYRIAQARAEVPEWCQQIIQALVAWGDGERLEMDIHLLCDDLTREQRKHAELIHDEHHPGPLARHRPAVPGPHRVRRRVHFARIRMADAVEMPRL